MATTGVLSTNADIGTTANDRRPSAPRSVLALLPLALIGGALWFEEPREYLRTAACLVFSALGLFWGRLACRGLVPVLRWGPMREQGLLPWLPLGLMGVIAMLLAAPIGFLTLGLTLVGLLVSERVLYVPRSRGITLFAAVLLGLERVCPFAR